jgi:thiopeptide-type bacteriocin biosynthesis protein
MSLSLSHYSRIQAVSGRLEQALGELVAPLLHDVWRDPSRRAAFFARYRSEALLFILGEPEWTTGPARALVDQRVETSREKGLVEGCTFLEYQPEVERYGGEEGLRLAERIFEEDSRACLDLMEAERAGLLGRTRREHSLVLTERFLDLLGFDREARVSFYRFSYAWAIEQGTWGESEIRLLEDRYRELKPGLSELLDAALAGDSETAHGGAEPARIARGWIEANQPIVAGLLEAHRAGRIRQDLVTLAWSYTHMHCNRLGLSGEAEAVLRFFMHRLYQDGRSSAP